MRECGKNYNVDQIMPIVSLKTEVSNAIVKVAASDVKDNLSDLARYEYKVDSGSQNISGTNIYTFPSLKDGEHIFSVRVKDSVFNTTPFSCKVGIWREYSTYRWKCYYTDGEGEDYCDSYAVICAGTKSKDSFACVTQEYIDSSGYLELNGKNVKLNESGYATEFYRYASSVNASYAYQKVTYTEKKYDGEYYYFDNPNIYYTSTTVYLQTFKI